MELLWKIEKKESSGEIRYCSGCKSKVEFMDSNVKRHNANGKNVFKFAIFKCGKGHTWNKLLRTYSASEYNKLSEVTSREEHGYKEHDKEKFSIHINQRIDFSETVNGIAIKVTASENGCSERLDKLLNDNSINISRSKLSEMVSKGQIVVNKKTVKSKHRIRDKDVIEIV